MDVPVQIMIYGLRQVVIGGSMVSSEDPWLDPDSQWYHHCNRTRARAPPRPFACATRTHNARVRRAGDDVRVNVGTEDLDTPLDSPLDTDLSQV